MKVADIARNPKVSLARMRPTGPRALEALSHGPHVDPVELDTDSLTAYLLNAGVLSPEDVVLKGVTIESASRRNKNYRVVVGGKGGFLVKQIEDWVDRETLPLDIEARVLRAIHSLDVLRDVRRFTPEYVLFDPRSHVLVTGLVYPATTLTKVFLHYGDVDFADEPARTAAELLSSVHKALRSARGRGQLDFLPRVLPNGLEAASEHYLKGQGRRGAAYWERIRDLPCIPSLARLREEWRTYEDVVHGDCRWDNFLVSYGAGATGGMNIAVIDWELARFGNPSWDVTCYLGDHFRFFGNIAMQQNEKSAEEILADPPYDLTKQWGAARVFWNTYCEELGLDAAARAKLRKDVEDYLPFYLILIGWERILGKAEGGHDALGDDENLTLELARRAAQDPAKLLAEWFGLERV